MIIAAISPTNSLLSVAGSDSARRIVRGAFTVVVASFRAPDASVGHSR
jgi:hypothetical protein